MTVKEFVESHTASVNSENRIAFEVLTFNHGDIKLTTENYATFAHMDVIAWQNMDIIAWRNKSSEKRIALYVDDMRDQTEN